MNSKRNVLWMAIAVAGLVMAGGARAQDDFGFEDESAAAPKPVYDNYIELGGGYTWDGNGKFGEYSNGLTDAFTDDGGFPVGALRLSGGDAATARSWEISAGLGNGRSLDASYGIQGNFGIELYGDRIEKTEFGDARTPYGGASDLLLLPDGYVPGVSNADPAFYSSQDIVSERQIFGLEGFKHVGEHWMLSLGFENQDKSGEDVFGANQGFGGSALAPKELDSQHTQMRLRLDYADNCLQQGVEAYVSKFDNGIDSYVFQNAVYPGSTGHVLGLQEVAAEPDNEFMRLSMDGGYNVARIARLSWFADWSRGKQDDDFLQVAYDSGYYPDVPLTYGYANLDGEIERTNLKLSLAGRPFARFDYRLEYAYKDRDAKHDPLEANELSYNYNTSSPGFSSKVYDKQITEYSAEAGYRFGGIGRLRGGLGRTDMDRDTDELEYMVPAAPGVPFYEPLGFTDSTSEDTAWLELSMNPADRLTLKLRGEHNEVSADLSNETRENVWPGGLLRRGIPYFLLDRDQDVVELEVNYELGANASVYAEYDKVSNDFDNDANGIDTRDSDIWNIGFNWSPSAAVNLSVYYSRESYKIEQHNRQMGSTPVPYVAWAMDTEDDVDAAGLSLDWGVVENRFDLQFDFSYLNADSQYTSVLVESTQSTPPSPASFGSTPDTSDELYRFSISGIYHWNPQIDVTGRFIYEDRDAEDWAYSTDISSVVDPYAGNARYLAFARERPDYSAKLVMLSVRYKF